MYTAPLSSNSSTAKRVNCGVNSVPPEKMPYVTPLKTRAGSPVALDSGDFPLCQRKAMEAIDHSGFPGRQHRAREAGRYLGLGISNGVKGTGRGPFESAIVRIGRSGRISLYTGAMPMGQGIKTALAQICADQFGVSPDTVSVTAGDTAVIPYGQGGFASRQTVTAGSSVHLAAAAVRAARRGVRAAGRAAARAGAPGRSARAFEAGRHPRQPDGA